MIKCPLIEQRGEERRRGKERGGGGEEEGGCAQMLEFMSGTRTSEEDKCYH